MKGEIVPYTGPRLSLDEAKAIGKAALVSSLFKVTTPEQAALQILMGQELGIGPMASLSAIQVIGDKPTVSANFMMALVKRSRPRYDFRPVVRTDKAARIEWYQDGRLWGVSEFTEEEAKAAGLLPPKQGSGWQKYRKAMLFARAVGVGFRLFCGELAFGGSLYASEELSDAVHPEDVTLGGDVIDVEVTSSQPRRRLDEALAEAAANPN